MSKVCKISNKKANNGYSISHSHVKTKKKQNVNLQNKKIWSISKKCWLKIRVSTKIIKSLHKIDL
uniref:Large ribosomal subunit protein bL28c n=2 Tax=Membranoptera TaxID=158697 RepID=A0A1L1YA32_9FLOR|nr:ribosomal protein L28 [Membranoptera weeksiae]YP_009332951.1 ribosomal protein L28 [Membranoptera tenuis]AHZ94745.1 ribosomal protein L28 [Membranoptera weeksiae]AKL79207.1 ribosomal protein L28 [Membranoptera tenuis]